MLLKVADLTVTKGEDSTGDGQYLLDSIKVRFEF
jgi:hypothetical protein